MNTTTANMKSHQAAGLDITGTVTWINHLGQPVPAVVKLSGRIWAVRTADGSSAGARGDILTTGGHGAKFTFSY